MGRNSWLTIPLESPLAEKNPSPALHAERGAKPAEHFEKEGERLKAKTEDIMSPAIHLFAAWARQPNRLIDGSLNSGKVPHLWIRRHIRTRIQRVRNNLWPVTASVPHLLSEADDIPRCDVNCERY